MKLSFDTRGNGQNVMMLHGWSCDSQDWDSQLDFFSARYRVTTLDLRGHGLSEAPKTRYTPLDFASDVEEFILCNFPGESFILVGHSMGGQIATLIADRRPDLVKAVVCVDGTLGLPSALNLPNRLLVALMSRFNPHVISSAVLKGLYGPETSTSLIHDHAIRLNSIPAYVLTQSFKSLFLGVGQVSTGKSSEQLCRRLKVPFYGIYCSRHRVARMSNWFSHPKSKLEVWSGTGHWIMIDRPDQFNNSVSAWIDFL